MSRGVEYMKKLLPIILILFLFTNVISIFIPVFAEESSSAAVSFSDRDGWVSMVDGCSGGQFDFSRLQQYPQPFVNENGRTMFPILYFDEIFRDGLSYDINDNTITITKNILDVITTVSITIDSDVLIRNGEEIIMDTVPIRIGETIFIPLRCDGYDIVIEGVKNGVYHIVNRWRPTENDPSFYIEKYFENLVKEKFPE